MVVKLSYSSFLLACHEFVCLFAFLRVQFVSLLAAIPNTLRITLKNRWNSKFHCRRNRECATKMFRLSKFASTNFGWDTLNFMKHPHACLCNDHTGLLDLVLDQLGLIHCTLAANSL